MRADSQAVQQYNENLNHLLQGLLAECVNTIIDTVNDLCWSMEFRFYKGQNVMVEPES